MNGKTKTILVILGAIGVMLLSMVGTFIVNWIDKVDATTDRSIANQQNLTLVLKNQSRQLAMLEYLGCQASLTNNFFYNKVMPDPNDKCMKPKFKVEE